MNSKLKIAFFDSHGYEREAFGRHLKVDTDIEFIDGRLTSKTARLAAGFDAVCSFVNDRVDEACLEELSKLGVRMVALRCAGFNHVDLKAAEKLGIVVARVPAYSPHAVAEHAVALLMTLNRKTHRAHSRVRELNFSLEGLVGFDLYQKVVSVFGTGKIGDAFCRILIGFGCEVLASDPNPSAELSELGVRYTTKEELLRKADVVALHMPLSSATRHFIGESELSMMKPGATLINTSRGGLVDTKAMIDALKKGHLGGAALDVYEEEEGVFFEDHSGHVLQDDTLARLLTFPNVLITSHQAFLTREALDNIAQTTLANVAELRTGRYSNRVLAKT